MSSSSLIRESDEGQGQSFEHDTYADAMAVEVVRRNQALVEKHRDTIEDHKQAVPEQKILRQRMALAVQRNANR